MLKIAVCIAAMALATAAGAVEQTWEERAKGVRWQMDKLRTYVEEAAYLYADEFKAKEKFLKEISKIVKKIENLSGDETNEADLRVRATAHLYRALADRHGCRSSPRRVRFLSVAKRRSR